MTYIVKKSNDNGIYVDSENKRYNLVEAIEGVDIFPGQTFKNTGPKTIEDAIVYYGLSLFEGTEESSEDEVTPVPVFSISKYLLIKNLMALGKDDEFYAFLENPLNIKIKRLWDTAQI